METQQKIKASFISAFVSALLLTMTGCAGTKSWTYSPNPRQTHSPLVDKSMVVLPFQDMRPNKNKNLWAMYLIPLMPFGWANGHTPEGMGMHLNSGQWQFRPAEDFAKATAQEFENARIFRETYPGNKASDGDLVLMGEIVATDYHGKLISYGLSVYGPILWLVGFPAGTHENKLNLRLTIARNPSSPALWSHTIEKDISKVSWIYYLRPDFLYDEMLKAGLTEAISQLANEPEALEKLK